MCRLEAFYRFSVRNTSPECLDYPQAARRLARRPCAERSRKRLEGGIFSATGLKPKARGSSADWDSRHLGGGYSTVTGTPPTFLTVAAP